MPYSVAIVRAMVTEYGMSEKLGFQLYGLDDGENPWEQPHQAYSEETARKIDEEVKNIIDTNYAKAEEMLANHREELDRLAKALLRYETLTFEEVEKVINGKRFVSHHLRRPHR